MAEAPPPYRALLIGNADFPDEPELHALRGPANDLRELGAALTDPEVGLPWQVSELLDRGSQEVEEAMYDFFEGAARDDQLLLYYSGHGLLDIRGRLCLCTQDTTLARRGLRAVHHSYVTDLMDHCPARTIIVVLDCCYSGRAADAKGPDPAAPFEGRGRVVISSCERRGTAWDAPSEGEPSLFTGHLVAALRHGAVAHDGYVTAYEVLRYVNDQLRGTGQLSCSKTEEHTGDIRLARRPVPVERTVEPAGRSPREASLDTCPVFTPTRGPSKQPSVECHFTGAMHVLLPGSRGTLSVYLDTLLAAASGGEVQGWWFAAQPLGYRRRRARLTGTATPDGGVRFTLPDGVGGRVTWPAEQLKAFEQARATSSWPTTERPTQPDATHTVLKAHDRKYRMLTRAPWTLAGSLIAFAASVVMTVLVLTPHVPDQIPIYPFILDLLSGLFVSAFTYRVWVRSQLQRFLRIPELPVRRMLLNTYVEPAYTTVTDQGMPVTIPSKERTYLWSEDYTLALPSGFFNDIPPCPSPLEPDAPLPVEVMGLPYPGEWVLVRSPQGTLWPAGRVKHCYSSDFDRAIRRHRPLPRGPLARRGRK
ncbi:caspase family protein [Streptomyces sp. ERV7]|uniref:caspase family protein n=1 Tax=Streptomyces sp. ERV7 TaxID=1322334 RepID=UPI000A445FB5|nr:caspase family protein [Streptomyces sp. ERV7]